MLHYCRMPISYIKHAARCFAVKAMCRLRLKRCLEVSYVALLFEKKQFLDFVAYKPSSHSVLKMEKETNTDGMRSTIVMKV